MLLVLDMGNTNITVGVFDGDRLVVESRLATDYRKMEDEYAMDLMDILRLYHLHREDIDGAIFSSVVPSLDRALRNAVRKVTEIEPLQVGPGVKSGMDIRIDNPRQLGADLLVGAVAALAKYGAPCLLWDLGTATKVSVIDKNGAFRGGAIMPGVRTSLDSLSNATALLPTVSIDVPASVIGTNTVDCMASGTVFGTACTIDGMSDRIEAELGYPVNVVATGGLAGEIVAQCRREIPYDSSLLLDGLRLIWLKNQK
ncbi:MAG: type III pantothenate kinase [Ruminococcaceae bacterium]|nr:type III pantothenate kinase [Oscillospiraceae bacterium]